MLPWVPYVTPTPSARCRWPTGSRTYSPTNDPFSFGSTGTAARAARLGCRCIAAGVRPWTWRRRRACRSRSRWSYRIGGNERDYTCGAPPLAL